MSAKIFYSNHFDPSLSPLSDLTLPPLKFSSPLNTSDEEPPTPPRPVPLILQPELSTVRQLSTQLQPFLHIQPFMFVQPQSSVISQFQLLNEMTFDPIIEAGLTNNSFVQEQLNNSTPPHSRMSTLKAHPHNHRHTEESECFLKTPERPVILCHDDNDKENTPPPRTLKEVTCEECGKIYRGKNARSILRRHLKDKHKIEQPRATRWDNDPNRPKTDEERRQRMLESKRKSAQKARAKKNLMKEMAQQENMPTTDASITQNLMHRLKQWSVPSTPPSTSSKLVHTINSPNCGTMSCSTINSSKATSPFFSSPRNSVIDVKPFNHHLCSSPIHYHYNNTQLEERKTTNDEINPQNY